MKEKDFRRWVRRKLGDDGACTVKTELTDDQIDQSLSDAKEWWNSYCGLHKEQALAVVNDKSEYDLTAIAPRVEDVVAVWMPDRANLLDFRGLYPGFLDINGFPYGTLGFGNSNSPQGTIVQTLQNIESAQRILSSDPDWEFYSDDIDENTPIRTLRIFPPPSDSGNALFLYRVDPRDIKLHMYSQRDLFLIREYGLAEAKYILGRIRGKYASGLPAAGGERTLDGEALISESREDKERLDAKILSHQGPIMPLVG